VLRRWGRRREVRSLERELDDDFSEIRRQMADDAKRLAGGWQELDRLEAEIARKRAELERLEQQWRRERQHIAERERPGGVERE
jgi:chromosome segregation ATPase